MDTLQLKKIEEYVMPDTGLEPVKLAILFGARDGVDLISEETYQLWCNGYFQYLIISGGFTSGMKQSEAEVIKNKLLQIGLPEDVILLEDQATNTGENVIFSKQVAEKNIGLKNITSVICIGKISSTRRYLMTMERHWPGLTKYMLPVNCFNMAKSEWHTHEEFKTRVLKEWKKIPEYIELGFLTEIP